MHIRSFFFRAAIDDRRTATVKALRVTEGNVKIQREWIASISSLCVFSEKGSFFRFPHGSCWIARIARKRKVHVLQ